MPWLGPPRTSYTSLAAFRPRPRHETFTGKPNGCLKPSTVELECWPLGPSFTYWIGRVFRNAGMHLVGEIEGDAVQLRESAKRGVVEGSLRLRPLPNPGREYAGSEASGIQSLGELKGRPWSSMMCRSFQLGKPAPQVPFSPQIPANSCRSRTELTLGRTDKEPWQSGLTTGRRQGLTVAIDAMGAWRQPHPRILEAPQRGSSASSSVWLFSKMDGE